MTIDQYFEKYGIDKNNIVWITRDKITTKTYIHMISGREIVIRRLPISSLREQMDEGEFYFIGNSTIVRVDYIERIDNNNYYMVDGSMQTGAKRMQPVHNYRKHYLNDKRIADEMTWGIGYIDIKKLPFEIMAITVQKDVPSQREKYTIQHCTDVLAEFVGINAQMLTGRSFFEVFPQATLDWRNAFRDAVYEGKTTRMLVDDKKHDREMYAVCVPMKSQTCLCIMLPLTQILGTKLTEL